MFYYEFRMDLQQSPINRKWFFSIIVLVVLLLTIPIAVYLSQKPQVFNPKAANNTNKNSIIVSGNRLIDSSTGFEFIVRSNQFVDIGYDLTPSGNLQPNLHTFTSNVYDRSKTDNEFSVMQTLGYNTIRVVFNDGGEPDDKNQTRLCTTGTNGAGYSMFDCMSKATVDNLIETVKLADKHNIKVLITIGEGAPPRYNNSGSEYFSNYKNGNINYLRPQSVKDFGRYLNDLLTYMKLEDTPFEAILAIEPTPEPALDTKNFPFSTRVNSACDGSYYNCDFVPTNIEIKAPEFNVEPGKLYKADKQSSRDSGDSGWSRVVYVDSQGISRVIASAELKEIINYSFLKAFNSWFDIIHSHGLLTAYDQYLNAVANDIHDGRHIDDNFTFNTQLKADIIGIQVYPPNEIPDSFRNNPGSFAAQELEKYLSFTPGLKEKITNAQKPFLIWETGIDKQIPIKSGGNVVGYLSYPANINYLIDWQIKTCQLNPKGWNLFYWTRAANDHGSFSASYVNGLRSHILAELMSPLVRPNPCQGQGQAPAKVVDALPIAAITASASHTNNPANLAIDGNSDTDWNSGSGPWKYIDLDLGKPVKLSGIRLLTSQAPSGSTPRLTHHKICVGLEPAPEFCLTDLKGETSDRQWLSNLEVAALGAIKYIRIWTYTHPDWPAWREIEVYSSTPEPIDGTPPAKAGDVDGDGDVDIFDYNSIVTDFGKVGGNLQADLNKNGSVDIFDYNLVVSNFGK